VQPDGLIISPHCVVMIEAKRIRKSKFQTEQLAREYIALMRDAAGRTPLLLLMLGSDPPASVDGHGRIGIEEAVSLHLASVLAKSDGSGLDHGSLLEQIPDVLAWTTWTEMSAVVAKRAGEFTSTDTSVQASVRRLAESLTSSIHRHAEARAQDRATGSRPARADRHRTTYPMHGGSAPRHRDMLRSGGGRSIRRGRRRGRAWPR
jgi:hypothetical protein